MQSPWQSADAMKRLDIIEIIARYKLGWCPYPHVSMALPLLVARTMIAQTVPSSIRIGHQNEVWNTYRPRRQSTMRFLKLAAVPRTLYAMDSQNSWM